MDISTMRPVDTVVSSYTNSSNSSNSLGRTDNTNVRQLDTNTAKNATLKIQDKDKQPVDEQQLNNVSEALNKFMTLMNADLQFEVHEKTQRLIVKLVDTKENKVLKEFPPKEFLDTVAKIQEYVGFLLDKKA